MPFEWQSDVLTCFCFQAEQLQLKLLQEKDLNDQLELNKATIERQVCVCVCLLLVVSQPISKV